MPIVDGNPIDETRDFTDYVFRVQSDPGTQLRTFTVRDRMGMVVTAVEPPLEPCVTENYECVARRIFARQFPLSVEVDDCNDNHFGPDEFPLFGVPPGPTDGRPSVPFPCSSVILIDNPPCDEAQRQAQMQRNRTVLACTNVRDLRREFRLLLALAAGLLLLFWAFFFAAGIVSAVGGWVGAIVATALFAIAGAFFIAAMVTGMNAAKKKRELNFAEGELRVQQGLFNDALTRVYEVCCPGNVHIDTQMPCGDVDVFGHSVLPTP